MRLSYPVWFRLGRVRGGEIDGIEVTPWHKLFEVDNLRAFDVQCLQFLGGKRDELAATVFVTLDDFRLVNLLTCPRIMRPNSDPGKGLRLICVIAIIVSGKVRQRRLGSVFGPLFVAARSRRLGAALRTTLVNISAFGVTLTPHRP
jgi:hypothetical protein